MPQFQQVTGGACSVTMYSESSPGVVSAGTKGIKLAFSSENMRRGSSKKQSDVITGKRGAGRPYDGIPDLSGQFESAPYSPQLGHLFRAICGPAVTAAETARALDAAPVVELGVGLVGIACAGHGFVQDAAISIVGTVNYDGTYRVEKGSTDDVIAIAAPYVAETVPSSAKAHRGRAASLKGAAKSLSGGLVALPVDGIHDLNPGEKVTIEGTVEYDGTYTLEEGGAESELVIEAVFEAETFGAGCVALPLFFRHSFVLPKRQPTVCLEKHIDYEAGAAENAYSRFAFCKVNGFSFNFGGDDELKFSLDFAVGQESAGNAPLDASPVQLPAVVLNNVETSIWISGTRRGEVSSGDFNSTFGIEPQTAVGDLGQYSRMPEGDPSCQSKLTVFVESDELDRMAKNRNKVSYAVAICSISGDEVWFHYPECELDSQGPAISGKAGLMQEITAMGYVDQGESVLEFELVNRVGSYA